jgi:hypothetical protein
MSPVDANTGSPVEVRGVADRQLRDTRLRRPAGRRNRRLGIPAFSRPVRGSCVQRDGSPPQPRFRAERSRDQHRLRPESRLSLATLELVGRQHVGAGRRQPQIRVVARPALRLRGKTPTSSDRRSRPGVSPSAGRARRPISRHRCRSPGSTALHRKLGAPRRALQSSWPSGKSLEGGSRS